MWGWSCGIGKCSEGIGWKHQADVSGNGSSAEQREGEGREVGRLLGNDDVVHCGALKGLKFDARRVGQPAGVILERGERFWTPPPTGLACAVGYPLADDVTGTRNVHPEAAGSVPPSDRCRPRGAALTRADDDDAAEQLRRAPGRRLRNTARQIRPETRGWIIARCRGEGEVVEEEEELVEVDEGVEVDEAEVEVEEEAL
ncbi:unnamed protein product [Lampetra planeri]